MVYLNTQKTPETNAKSIMIKNTVLPLEKISDSIDSLYSGLIFWAPLSQNKTFAETGQEWTTDGNLSYQEHYGISCVTGDSISELFCSDTNFPVEKEPCTMSIWICKADDFDSSILNSPICYGNQADAYKDRCIITSANDSFLGAGGNSEAMIGTTPLPDKRWIHCLATFTPEETGILVSLYLDGELDSSGTLENLSTELSSVRLIPRGVYLAGARIYNRVLSGDEIQRLSEEYVPDYPKYPQNLTSETSDPDWEIYSIQDAWKVFSGKNDAGPFSKKYDSSSSNTEVLISWKRVDKIPFHASSLVIKTNEATVVENFSLFGEGGFEGWITIEWISVDGAFSEVATLFSETSSAPEGTLIVPVNPDLEIIGFRIHIGTNIIIEGKIGGVKVNITGIEVI